MIIDPRTGFWFVTYVVSMWIVWVGTIDVCLYFLSFTDKKLPSWVLVAALVVWVVSRLMYITGTIRDFNRFVNMIDEEYARAATKKDA